MTIMTSGEHKAMRNVGKLWENERFTNFMLTFLFESAVFDGQRDHMNVSVYFNSSGLTDLLLTFVPSDTALAIILPLHEILIHFPHDSGKKCNVFMCV